MPDEKAPRFTIDADDPAFIPTLREYAKVTGGNRDMPSTERRARLDEIDALVREARKYQEAKRSRKKDLGLKRQWNTVEE